MSRVALKGLLGRKLRAKLPSLRPSGSLDPQIAALLEHLETSADRNFIDPAPAPDRSLGVTHAANY